MLAFLTGVIRMILAFVYYSSGGCGKDDNRPAILKNFHYMYFSLFITLLTGVTAIVISYFTGRPHEKYLTRTTFWTRKSAPYIEETEPDKLDKDKENGFTNLAATGDNNMHVFSVEEKHHYRDPKLDEPEEDKEMHCAEKALNYVCGITNEVDEEKERQLRLHMEKVACLEQNKYAKIGLNIGLVIILSLGVFLYIFWSFWKYEP
ncbi:sodium/myo-inositol cotransporter 2-like [Ruditapes philippinarum]|uniref:sodium/myo-inositol cotransporter 2-like n=1 Tax=Ruditapes philippinarum TaxID=129788 RepID=UPI00295A704E|nr:sodium/myo-inositol cotransporter 2-like [Ruditapes philippinarum]